MRTLFHLNKTRKGTRSRLGRAQEEEQQLLKLTHLNPRARPKEQDIKSRNRKRVAMRRKLLTRKSQKNQKKLLREMGKKILILKLTTSKATKSQTVDTK